MTQLDLLCGEGLKMEEKRDMEASEEVTAGVREGRDASGLDQRAG